MRPALRMAVLSLLAMLTGSGLAREVGATACEDGSPAAYFELETQSAGCHLIFGPDPVFLVTVRLSAIPAQRARFSLPDPPAGIVLGTSWNFPSSGDRITGLELDLGSCTGDGSLVLGTLLVLLDCGTTIDCLPWQVDDGCEVADCDGVWRPAQAVLHAVSDPSTPFCDNCCWQCCNSLPPDGLVPANGATAVPTNSTLSWSGAPYLLTPQDEEFFDCFVRISTDPACDTGQVYPVPCFDHSFAPDFLQPDTTYYWQVSYIIFGGGCSSGYSASSSIQSFTTGGPIAVAPFTWGRLKVIYRE